ncbi:MAG: hypothetical protein AAB257_09295 [Nitrospinota bacterium]
MSFRPLIKSGGEILVLRFFGFRPQNDSNAAIYENLCLIFICVSFLVLSGVSEAASLTPSLTAGVGYDDNIDFLASDVSRDGLFLIRPRIDFGANLSGQDIISGAYSYTFQRFFM